MIARLAHRGYEGYLSVRVTLMHRPVDVGRAVRPGPDGNDITVEQPERGS